MTRLSITAFVAISMLLGCGTRESSASVEVDVGSIKIRPHLVTVTAYTSSVAETDNEPCIAADRSDICDRYAQGELICATGDRDIPFGTKLEVPDYGTCTVADRMNKRFIGTGKVDVYLGFDLESARKWGLKKLKVKTVDPLQLAAK